jgi:flagellar protein FlgJ
MADSIKGIGLAGMNPEQSITQLRLQQLDSQVQQAGRTAKAAKGAGQLQQAATDFEAMLVKQMLSAMWASVPKGGMLSGSQEEGFYRDMLNDEVAKHIASNQSLGIRDVILKEMGELEGSDADPEELSALPASKR